MIELVVLLGAVICAFMAIQTGRLLGSALWLAGASALVALTLYLLGAAQVAVLELSVGAGLVTVLFVFAIGIAGDDPLEGHPIVPRPVSAFVVILSILLLGYLNLPAFGREFLYLPPGTEMGSLSMVLWRERALDVLVQVVLIFCGVLGTLGLLGRSPERAADKTPLHGKAHP